MSRFAIPPSEWDVCEITYKIAGFFAERDGSEKIYNRARVMFNGLILLLIYLILFPDCNFLSLYFITRAKSNARGGSL